MAIFSPSGTDEAARNLEEEKIQVKFFHFVGPFGKEAAYRAHVRYMYFPVADDVLKVS